VWVSRYGVTASESTLVPWCEAIDATLSQESMLKVHRGLRRWDRRGEGKTVGDWTLTVQVICRWYKAHCRHRVRFTVSLSPV